MTRQKKSSVSAWSGRGGIARTNQGRRSSDDLTEWQNALSSLPFPERKAWRGSGVPLGPWLVPGSPHPPTGRGTILGTEIGCIPGWYSTCTRRVRSPGNPLVLWTFTGNLVYSWCHSYNFSLWRKLVRIHYDRKPDDIIA
jgi:hypothetical protein